MIRCLLLSLILHAQALVLLLLPLLLLLRRLDLHIVYMQAHQTESDSHFRRAMSYRLRACGLQARLPTEHTTCIIVSGPAHYNGLVDVVDHRGWEDTKSVMCT